MHNTFCKKLLSAVSVQCLQDSFSQYLCKSSNTNLRKTTKYVFLIPDWVWKISICLMIGKAYYSLWIHPLDVLSPQRINSFLSELLPKMKQRTRQFFNENLKLLELVTFIYLFIKLQSTGLHLWLARKRRRITSDMIFCSPRSFRKCSLKNNCKRF